MIAREPHEYTLVDAVKRTSARRTRPKPVARHPLIRSDTVCQNKCANKISQAVKSVLVMAGSLKRGYPDVDEDLTLIRALVDSNVPKFLADDLPLFAAIVKVICRSLRKR